jgi:hypothetical protein
MCKSSVIVIGVCLLFVGTANAGNFVIKPIFKKKHDKNVFMCSGNNERNDKVLGGLFWTFLRARTINLLLAQASECVFKQKTIQKKNRVITLEQTKYGSRTFSN